MDSVHLIRDNLVKSRDRVLARIEDMSEHALVYPTPNGGAHTLWVLGHLAYIEALVIRVFMRGEANPLAEWEATFDGPAVAPSRSATRAAVSETWPRFEVVLGQCREMRAATFALLAELSESDLDRESAACPRGHEETFGTWRLCFQYVADHWYMHRGQLADARRAAGVGKMWY